MCVFVVLCVCFCVCVCVCACEHTRVHTSVHECAHICMCAYMCVCVCVCVHVCGCMCVLCAHICTVANIFSHPYVYIDTHIQNPHCPGMPQAHSRVFNFRKSDTTDTHTRLYTHAHARSHTHTSSSTRARTHTHTHTHTPTPVPQYESGDTGWRRPIGCLFFMGHFPQKSSETSGSFAPKDLQLKAPYAHTPPCLVISCSFYDSLFFSLFK